MVFCPRILQHHYGEEMIEGLSFAAFWRVARMIEVSAEAGPAIMMLSIGSVELSNMQLQRRD